MANAHDRERAKWVSMELGEMLRRCRFNDMLIYINIVCVCACFVSVAARGINEFCRTDREDIGRELNGRLPIYIFLVIELMIWWWHWSGILRRFIAPALLEFMNHYGMNLSWDIQNICQKSLRSWLRVAECTRPRNNRIRSHTQKSYPLAWVPLSIQFSPVQTYNVTCKYHISPVIRFHLLLNCQYHKHKEKLRQSSRRRAKSTIQPASFLIPQHIICPPMTSC